MANNVEQPEFGKGLKEMKKKERTFFNVYYIICFWLGIVLLNPIMGFVEYEMNPETGKEEWMFVGSVMMEVMAGCIGFVAGYILINIYASSDPRLINPHLSLRYAKMKQRLVETISKATPFIFFFSVGCTAGFTKGVWAFFISGIITILVTFGYFTYVTLVPQNKK